MANAPQADKALFVATADKTITNTATETSAAPTGWGTMTLPANSVIAGSRYRITASGVYSTPAILVDITVKIKVGSVTVASNTTSALLNSAVDKAWKAEAIITFRTTGASGTAVCAGYINYAASSGRVFDDLDNSGSESTIDTTVSNDVDVTVEWDAATTSRSVKITTFELEEVN